MTAIQVLKAAKKLSIGERERIAHELLVSVEEDELEGDLSPALRAELDRRLDELEEHPERCLSLEESDRRIKRLLRRTQPKRCSR